MIGMEYEILQQDDVEKKDQVMCSEQPYHKSRTAFNGLIVLLLTSVCINAFCVYEMFHSFSGNLKEVPTLYAELRKNVPTPFAMVNDFISDNRTVEDEAWNSPALVPDQGLIALSDDYVQSKNLPMAQRFPWDASKGTYLLNGFHNIHCLHILRRSILEAFDGKPQANPREHAAHCLNTIREALMCDPDDTPRYTGRVNQQSSAEHPESGVGQIRMCKSWAQLQSWAIEHSACYRAINFSNPDFPPIERYKFCPNGEQLWS